MNMMVEFSLSAVLFIFVPKLNSSIASLNKVLVHECTMSYSSFICPWQCFLPILSPKCLVNSCRWDRIKTQISNRYETDNKEQVQNMTLVLEEQDALSALPVKTLGQPNPVDYVLLVLHCVSNLE